MRMRIAALPAMALTLSLSAATAAHANGTAPTPAQASPSMPGMPGMPGMKMPSSAPAADAVPEAQDINAAIARARQTPIFLAAQLVGRNEVPVAGKPAVGDKDGSVTGIVRVQGNRVTFAFSWKNITAPTLGHIHQGAAGTNGERPPDRFVDGLR